MSIMRHYTEDNYGGGSMNESALKTSFGKMKSALSKVGLDPFRNVDEICKNPEYIAILTESIKLEPKAGASKYVIEDMSRLNTLYENVGASLLNEAAQGVSSLSPIMINSFGIQERALISAHLPRAVKQVTAKVPDFKLTERIPYIVDIAGNKQKFIDAFVPDESGNSASLSLRDIVTMGFAINDTNVNLFTGNGTDTTDPDYRPAVDKNQIFGVNSSLESVSITPTATWTLGDVNFTMKSQRTPDVENGNFSVGLTWTETKDGETDVKASANVSGQFDLPNGKLLFVSSTSTKVTHVSFKMVLSPETHTKALTVGYDTRHTPVNIPVGEHFQYMISEEFKDSADKYYNVDAMALLTDYMGRAVEQVKDIDTLAKYKELAENAVVKTSFNCTPTTAFAQGKEEYIRREFNPFIEKLCIVLKNKVRIPNCHFRVLGNPLDIRLGASAGVEYIYKRNEQFAGEIGIDYEFSVMSDSHKIFYLSSERVPLGKLYIFLVPNSIENNISTVNHYEYATYVSNKYRGTNSNLPTVMISTRYLTKEYYPVVGVVDILNNLIDDSGVTTATGTGLSSSVYNKVKYVNA